MQADTGGWASSETSAGPTMASNVTAGDRGLHTSREMSLRNILGPAQQEVVREERRILNELRASLIRFGASDENMAPLERSIEGLDELFLLVVVGEFNAGKSAFINALTGERRT
jgi:ribosome biogenesis GTPase A